MAEDKKEILSQETDNTPDYVKMMLDSGITPIEMKFSQINSPYSKAPIAYRTETDFNSILSGKITTSKYSYAADDTSIAVNLAKWNVLHAIDAIKKMERAGRNVEFITTRISPRVLVSIDIYEFLKNIFNSCAFRSPEKLVLEFPSSLLFEDKEKVKQGLLTLKLLKVQSAMSGCGSDDCPVTRLFDLPLDFVIVEKTVTDKAASREGDKFFTTFVDNLRSMGFVVLCEGLSNDAQVPVFTRSEVYGYIPSPEYHGQIVHGPLKMNEEDAILQKETYEV